MFPAWGLGFRWKDAIARSYVFISPGLPQFATGQACVRFLIAQLKLAGDANRRRGLFQTHNTYGADIVG